MYAGPFNKPLENESFLIESSLPIVPGKFLAIASMKHIAAYSPPLSIKSPIEIYSSTYLSINL